MKGKKIRPLRGAYSDATVGGIDDSVLYTMDGKPDKWKIVYFPIGSNYRETEIYAEPRALVQNIDKPGFWHKEVPLRYLDEII